MDISGFFLLWFKTNKRFITPFLTQCKVQQQFFCTPRQPLRGRVIPSAHAEASGSTEALWKKPQKFPTFGPLAFLTLLDRQNMKAELRGRTFCAGCTVFVHSGETRLGFAVRTFRWPFLDPGSEAWIPQRRQASMLLCDGPWDPATSVRVHRQPGEAITWWQHSNCCLRFPMSPKLHAEPPRSPLSRFCRSKWSDPCRPEISVPPFLPSDHADKRNGGDWELKAGLKNVCLLKLEVWSDTKTADDAPNPMQQ